MKDGFFTVDNQSVASVMATLVAHNILSPFSQQVYDLTLTFVTPLGAQYDDVLTHFKITRLLKNGFYHPNSSVSALLAYDCVLFRLNFKPPCVHATCSRSHSLQPLIPHQNAAA
ncbi:hypothetical protein D3C75_1087270 [compost metagenome]